MKKLHKCKAANCVYETRDIDPKDEVFFNGYYLHKKCKELRELHGACVGAYNEKIDSTVAKTVLGKVFKEMIYVKKIDPKYILFVIQYCETHNEKPKSIFSLYYILNKVKIKRAYEEYKEQPAKFDLDKAEITPEVHTTYKKPNEKGWNKIFKS